MASKPLYLVVAVAARREPGHEDVARTAGGRVVRAAAGDDLVGDEKCRLWEQLRQRERHAGPADAGTPWSAATAATLPAAGVPSSTTAGRLCTARHDGLPA